MADHEYAVTAIGVDRPGIVAAVAGALVEVGGNVEDSAMTILGGHFAIVLLVATDASAAALEAALVDATVDLGLTISVNPIAVDESGARAPRPTHVLSVYGADKPGILAGITAAIADAGANVTDLQTRVLSPDTNPVYAMVIEVVASDEATLANGLDEASDALGVDHTLRELHAETY